MGNSNDIREDTYGNGDSTSFPNGGHSSEAAGTRSSSLREQRNSKMRSDMSVEDMYTGEYGVDDDEDSDWEPFLPQIDENGGSAPVLNEILNSEAGSASSSYGRERRNGKRRSDMTVEDMYKGEYSLEDDEEEEDSDWEPVLPQIDENGSSAPISKEDLSSEAATACSTHVHEQRNGKRRSDMSIEDKCDKEYGFEDEEEEEDSDWEPLPQIDENGFLQFSKWFCKNCTMANLDTEVRCDVCGEHRESGILKHGFLASAFIGVETFPDNVVDAADKLKDSSLQNNAPQNNTAVGYDERMLLHEEVDMKARPHPERPDRLRAIAASLATAGIFPGRCSSIPAREITREELQMIHSIENIDAVQHTTHFLSSYFTPDTYANQYSACAARLAAGLCYDLAVAICSGKAKNGFALVRPPGHHAGVKQAMGFCLHNNAAIAASAAQFAGAKKILIVDWDVHHGNGTQEIFEKNSSVLYISLHRHEGGNFYPGTGAADEVGSMGAEGYCVNVPWSKGGVGDNDYVFAFNQVVLPIASEFNPDFTIISAGFDAARGDPLGCCDVTPTGYAQMTQMCSALSGGKLMVILEGGYNLRSISSSATAVIKVLLGESSDNVEQVPPTKAGLQTVLEVMKIQMNYWPLLEPKYLKLQSEWGNYALQDKKKPKKQKRLPSAPMWWNLGHKRAPFWWKLGRKRWLYQAICKKFS